MNIHTYLFALGVVRPHLGLTVVLDVVSALRNGLVLTNSRHPDWMDIYTYRKSIYSDIQLLSDHIKSHK